MYLGRRTRVIITITVINIITFIIRRFTLQKVKFLKLKVKNTKLKYTLLDLKIQIVLVTYEYISELLLSYLSLCPVCVVFPLKYKEDKEEMRRISPRFVKVMRELK
jgi:uncharacterized paraquat-inducible protein A